MSEPRRLLEDDAGIERLLVRAGAEEVPPPDLRRRMDIALGVAVAASVLAKATAGSAAASSGIGAAAGASKAAPAVTALVLSKWVGIAVVVGAAAVGTSSYLSPGSGREVAVTAPGPVVAAAPRARASAIPPPLPTVPVASPVSTTAAVFAATTSVASTTPAALRSPGAPAPVPGAEVSASPVPAARVAGAAGAAIQQAQEPTVAAEMQMIDDAKAALREGDPARAIQLVDRHDLAYERPRLAPEALVVRIEAYAARRDRPQTVDLCGKFLRLYADLPQAQHVRSILAASNP